MKIPLASPRYETRKAKNEDAYIIFDTFCQEECFGMKFASKGVAEVMAKRHNKAYEERR